MTKKVFRNLGFIASGFMLLILSCIFFTTGAKENYSDVMRKANEQNSAFGDSKVYEIGILGSHDAMSDKITKDSEIDYGDDVPDLGPLIHLGLVRSIIANYCRTQSKGLYEQFKAGVRYVDGRITCKNGVFYTSHGMISDKLENYLRELITFLLDNPGEFIIFHIAQYNKTEGNTENDLAEYMQNVKVTRDGRDYSIYDFINYNTYKDFSDVTYNDVTRNGQKGGLIIVSKFQGRVSNPSLSNFFRYRQYYSTWYNKPDHKLLLSMVDDAVQKYKGVAAFRCNGFHTTQNAKSIALHLGGSLISNAESENIETVNHSHFDYWLSFMPMACFDEVTSTEGDFNAKINEKILNYNLNLNKHVEMSKYQKIIFASQLEDGMKIMIKEFGGTNGYYGDNYKPGNIGSYVGDQFVMKDKNMWTLKKSGNGWKIKRTDDKWLCRNLIGDLDTTQKEDSAIEFEFDFSESGTAKIHYDKYYMYLTDNKVLDISKKHSDEFEIYAE